MDGLQAHFANTLSSPGYSTDSDTGSLLAC